MSHICHVPRSPRSGWWASVHRTHEGAPCAQSRPLTIECFFQVNQPINHINKNPEWCKVISRPCQAGIFFCNSTASSLSSKSQFPTYICFPFLFLYTSAAFLNKTAVPSISHTLHYSQSVSTLSDRGPQLTPPVRRIGIAEHRELTTDLFIQKPRARRNSELF